MADVLGIFGKYGLYLSTYWHLGSFDREYISAAFKIYRNYDGAFSTFGDTKVHALMSNKVNSSIYASTFAADDTQLHIIVMNKNFDESINGVFNVTHPRVFTSGRVWTFDADSPDIIEIPPINAIVGNSFSYSIPPLTVCHIVLESNCPPGDLTGDCRLDVADLQIFCNQWLNSHGCEGFDCADLNRDTKINIIDYYLLAKNWNNE